MKKIDKAVAVTMLFTWLTNVWEWLGPNIGVLTGIMGFLIGVVTLLSVS